MAIDAHLRIDQIPGEDPDQKHARWIQIMSFTFSGNTGGSAGMGSGMAGGKVTCQDFVVTKYVCQSSPKLFQYCCAGQQIKDATVEFCRSGQKSAEQEMFLKYDFADMIVSSYSTGGSAGDGGLPMETISFNFSKMNMEYWTWSEGQKTDQSRTGYDMKRMTKI
jgi:type VI secretion system secreted protein Hcp